MDESAVENVQAAIGAATLWLALSALWPVAWILTIPWYYPAFGTVVLTAIEVWLLFFSGERSAPKRITVPTSAFISVDHGSLQTHLSNSENIKDWKMLYHEFNITNGAQVPICRTWTIFLLFEQPISGKEIVLTGIGCTLPIYHTEHLGRRHAIVSIEGDVAGMNIQLRVVLLDE